MEFLKTPSSLLSEEENDEFLSVFPSIVEDLTNNKDFENILGLEDHIKKLLHYVLPNGKKNRSMMFLATYKMLQKKENITSENKKHSYIFAWIGEIFVSFAEMMDDIVDRSETRRDLPCWHTINDRHFESVNDALFLEQAGFFLLRKYFSGHQHYFDIQNLLLDSLFKISIGQIADCMCKKNEEINWDCFTMEYYTDIVLYKTAANTFVPAITAAMYFANVTNTNLLNNKELKSLLLNMGEFYQVQNDFWDCFADPEATGKIGNDIREGKCTWLAVKALEIANSEQTKLMKKFYGKDTAEAEERIRDLYEELDLEKCYEKYKEESAKKVYDSIKKVPKEFSHQLLSKLAKKIYKQSFTFF